MASYTLATGGAQALPTFYPTAGDYSYFVSSWNPITPLPPLTIADQPSLPAVQTAMVNATSNSVEFAFAGPRDDPTNPQNGTVTCLFYRHGQLPRRSPTGWTSRRSGSSSQTSGSGNVNTSEGDLADHGGRTETDRRDQGRGRLPGRQRRFREILAVFTLDGTSTVEDPTTYYEAAGTYLPSGAGSLFLSGNGPRSIGDLQDLNVAGADGSDTVRIVTTMQNCGHSGAWDIDVSDLLPTGYTVSDVVAGSVAVVRSGTGAVLVPETGETLTDLFTAGGVTLEDPSRSLARPNCSPRCTASPTRSTAMS